MNDNSVHSKLQERFEQLPRVVQDAIKSSELEKNLRTLSNEHKLHVDQWESLENEVMMTLLGFAPVEELQNNIEKHVGVSSETATLLTDAVNRIVFEPIRNELERQLAHPQAKPEEISPMESVKNAALAEQQSRNDPIPTLAQRPIPATPPAPKPDAIMPQATPPSSAYQPGQPSSSRKEITADPYREPVA